MSQMFGAGLGVVFSIKDRVSRAETRVVENSPRVIWSVGLTHPLMLWRLIPKSRKAS